MEPAVAQSYVTTTTGEPLTLDDVQAKLASTQGGLGNFKGLSYETQAAAGIRGAQVVEIVKSIKAGLRGSPLSTLHPTRSPFLRRASTRVLQAAAADPEPEPEP